MKIKMKVIEFYYYNWFMFGRRVVDYDSIGVCFRDGEWVANHDIEFCAPKKREKAKQTLRIINRMKKWQ